jgi:hypothetical protein
MAGRGNPYAVITPASKALLRALHDADDRSDQFDNGLEPTLKLLESKSLIARDGRGRHRPSFFIADAREAVQVNAHAQAIGHALALEVERNWGALLGLYQTLKISKTIAFAETAFFLIGDHLLDLGLLDALARDATLMPGAPARPDPDWDDARYYCWMIEGDAALTGRYGQRYTDLPWAQWLLLTFGQYRVHGQPNTERTGLEQRTRDLAQTPGMTPSGLGTAAGIPVFARADTLAWERGIRPFADGLVDIYLRHQNEVRTVYDACRASQYAPHSFGDFVCWYDHLAYSHAIGTLEARGLMPIPPDRFVAALWYHNPHSNPF